jgi:hypothetical protein
VPKIQAFEALLKDGEQPLPVALEDVDDRYLRARQRE